MITWTRARSTARATSPTPIAGRSKSVSRCRPETGKAAGGRGMRRRAVPATDRAGRRAGRHAQGEGGPTRPVRGRQPRQSGGHPGEHPAGFGALVRPALLHDDPPGQVHRGKRRMGYRDVRPGHEEATGVDLDRDVRAAQPTGTGGLGAFPDQSSVPQRRAVAADRRGREPGEPGDGAAGDGAVVEDRAQHRSGTGRPPQRVGAGRAGRRNGAAGQGVGLRSSICPRGPSRSCAVARTGGPRRARDGRPTPGMGMHRKLHGGSTVHQNAGTLREFGIRAHCGAGRRRGIRAVAVRSGPLTRGGADTLQVDMTSCRQQRGSVHDAQHSRAGASRSIDCPHRGRPGPG